MRPLCISIALLCMAGKPAAFELNIDKPDCTSLLDQQKDMLDRACATRERTAKTSAESLCKSQLTEAEAQHQAREAELLAENTRLQAGIKAALAECSAKHLVRDDRSGGYKDKAASIHIYLKEAVVCGDFGILRFEIHVLEDKPEYRVARVEVTPPGGLPTTQTVFRATPAIDGVMVASVVFDVPKAKNTGDDFDFRFIGTNAESIFVADVSFPLAPPLSGS